MSETFAENPVMQQEIVRLGELRFSVHVAGDPSAPPIVFQHGGGLMGASWTKVVQGLADRYRCIVPDLRGHGDSEWSATKEYSLSDYGTDLARLIEHYDLDRPHLVGMSLGGQTALSAVCHGLPVSSLTLVDIGPVIVERGGGVIREYLNVTRYPDFESALDRAVEFNPRRSRESLAAGLRRSMQELPDGSLRWNWDPARLATRDARAHEASRLWPLLSNITAPLLLVRGGVSEVLTEQLAQEFVAELTRVGVDVEFATVPEAGHNVQTEQPAALVDLLTDFVTRVTAAESNSSPSARSGSSS